METRRQTLNAMKKCRFCLSNDESCSSLYDKSQNSRIPKSAISLPLQILSCVSVEVFPSDRMLTYICDRCRFFMDMCYRYKQMCREADVAVMQFIRNNSPMEPMAWPSKLARMYKSMTQPSRRQNKSTVHEPMLDNASIEEEEETDEDDNVYNIKIGDGPDDDSTCIKVVKSGDKLHITKDENKTKNKKATTPAPSRPFACKYCNKTFTKSHHHSRHMRVKHNGTVVTPRGPFGSHNTFGCDQCDESFGSQDELIYHSAKHATENLTCPLCHEKFEHVEEVSAHIKTHVDGAEFMCDLCELVFTSKNKLDLHLVMKHAEELSQDQDEESMDDGAFEDDSINIKAEGDDMIVEIKKPNEFIMSSNSNYNEATIDNTVSEDSESENVYSKLASIDTVIRAEAAVNTPKQSEKIVHIAKEVHRIAEKVTIKPAEKKNENQSAGILRKAEEIKRKVVQKPMEILSNVTIKPPTASTPSKVAKPEPATSAVGNDKSLKLLEKELEELCSLKANKKPVTILSKNSETKTPAKSVEILRNKRPQLHTSTPKPSRVVEEKKCSPSTRPVVDKRPLDRRTAITKENKEPKEKETKVNNKDDKEVKEQTEVKEQRETPKAVKNGAADKSTDETVRRSSRASKIKDYAKMIRDRDTSDDDTDDGDEEYKESDKSSEISRNNRSKKVVTKPVAKSASPAVAAAAADAASDIAPRKRGRPRKGLKEVPAKLKKPNVEESDEAESAKHDTVMLEPITEKKEVEVKVEAEETKESPSPKAKPAEEKSNLIMSPTGHTLKKVPIKSLPPGIKPMSLPMRSMTGELCEMQIGQKVVKVQKIVMTKAEVEAMAKKGLVEMKDGTMVLKQGIKLPTADGSIIKSTLVGENAATKQSPSKRPAPAPTRCIVDEDI